MYKILPRNIKELTPISGNRNTFGENTFCIEFEQLSFEQKLTVANDLVRQSIMYSENPDPTTEMDTLCGDSYTACRVLKKYLIDNELGVSHTIYFVEGKKYETVNMPSTHFIVLVSDENGDVYQLDPSPMVGYMCGKVEKWENKWYKRCIPLDKEKENCLMCIRKNIFLANKSGESQYAQNAYEKTSEMKTKYSLFSGYFDKLCLMTGKEECCTDIEKIRIENKPMLEKELKNKEKELVELQTANGSLKQQLNLIQYIHGIKVELLYEEETKILINGEYINVSNLTPRLIYSLKLNTVMIKPSSFFINKSAEFIKIMENEKLIFSGYMVNMGDDLKYGISRMNFFHPDGHKYLKEMNGPSFIFLINEPTEVLLKRKRSIRDKYSHLYDGEKVKWFNNEKIEWTSLGMNMVHSSDNSCEACCNFQSGYLESQLMTRFMYPNPKLIF